MLEITRVSTKGQIVIPSHIRAELGLKEGSQLVVSRMEDFILLKKISIPNPKEEFRRLTEIGQRHARKLGIKSEGDVARTIHAGRKAKG